MKAQILRVYADTSIFGGPFDEEFADASQRFFDQVRGGRFQLVTSAVVQAEMDDAPEQVRALFDELLVAAEIVPVSTAAIELQQAYLNAGIITPKWSTDALHVALATISSCPLIVSWNFKHIVHFQKIPLYNAVNILRGYANIAIHSPREVIAYDDENN